MVQVCTIHIVPTSACRMLQYYAVRIIAGLEVVRKALEENHAQILAGPDELGEVMEQALHDLGESYNTWHQRAFSRLREDKREKSQVKT